MLPCQLGDISRVAEGYGVEPYTVIGRRSFQDCLTHSTVGPSLKIGRDARIRTENLDSGDRLFFQLTYIPQKISDFGFRIFAVNSKSCCYAKKQMKAERDVPRTAESPRGQPARGASTLRGALLLRMATLDTLAKWAALPSGKLPAFIPRLHATARLEFFHK